MPFDVSWHTLLDACEDLPTNATIVTPLSGDELRIVDVQEQRIVVEDRDTGERQPLDREQFETLANRIDDANGRFSLDRLPLGADPYAAVLTLHPRFEIDATAGTIAELDAPTSQQVHDPDDTEAERTEPDLSVYADTLLLIDALERYDPDALEEMSTGELVDLYTLLSDVQRGADSLRQQVADVLLARLHHDRAVAGQYGSVQRTSRTRRSLRDEEEVLSKLEEEGVDREQVVSPDPKKVGDALGVTSLTASDVFEIEESEYVRKAEVDEDRKETRLQGLKDRLAASDEPESEQLREEIEELEARIEELTEFRSGQEFYTVSGGEP